MYMKLCLGAFLSVNVDQAAVMLTSFPGLGIR